MTTSTSTGCSWEQYLGLDPPGTEEMIMDFKDEDRDYPEDTPFMDPETGEPKAPNWLKSFYIGYTARAKEEEDMAWLSTRGATQRDTPSTPPCSLGSRAVLSKC